MFCKQCGREIPEGGKFCPECGTPVAQKTSAAKKRPRPVDAESSHTARPLADNPFQPIRPVTRVSVPVDVPADETDDNDEEINFFTDPVPAPVESENEPIDIPAEDVPVRTRPRPRPKPKAVAPVAVEETPAEEADTTEEADAPEKQPPFGADKPTIAPAPPKGIRRASTLIPKRMVPSTDDEIDNFFDEPSEEDEDYGEEQTFFERNMRSLVTFGLLIASLLILIGWLTLSSGGKVFMAGLGITQDAYAYKLLGDQYAGNDQLKSASGAYYQALKYDQDNYEYALLSAEAFYAIQDKELAAKAAQHAIALKPDEKAPYLLLAEMFPANARPANIAALLEDGAQRFGDSSLTQ